jgi:hypothetical protein
MKIVLAIGVAPDVVEWLDLGLAVTVAPDLLHRIVDDDPPVVCLLVEVVVVEAVGPRGGADLAVARLR